MALHVIPADEQHPAGYDTADHQPMPCCICHPEPTAGPRPDGSHGLLYTHRDMTADQRQEAPDHAAARP